MEKHHWPAAVLAAANIVLLVIDRAVAITTGEPTVITDDSRGGDGVVLLLGVLLGVTFLAAARVAHREAHRFASARRAARLARPVLTYGLLAIGAGFLTVYPLQTLVADEDSPAVQVSGLVAFAGLTAVFLACLVIGLAVIGRNPLGVGGRVLSALGPVIALTALLALVDPDLGSPVYCTMVVLAGTALLGVRAEPAAQPATRAAMASPTSAV